MKLNVVLRTCDRASIQNNRIVDKTECVIRCFNSLVTSLEESKLDYTLYVIDDGSNESTVETLCSLSNKATFYLHNHISDSNTSVLARSRETVKIAYDYIKTLPDDELVYIVEDDYLHYSNAIEQMALAWKQFSNWFPNTNISIFPQDFNQLYYHPNNDFNETYVKPCLVLAGPDRYYRTTWYTHESFMCSVSLIKKYETIFDELLLIGTEEGKWEGNSISKVWTNPDVAALMPIGTLAIHLGNERDISNFTDWKTLWELNQIS